MAIFDFSAAAEGCLQFMEQILQLHRGPDGGEAFEDEDGFTGAVGGGAAEQEFFFGGCGLFGDGLDARAPWGKIAALEVEGGEGVGAQLGGGLDGDALFFVAWHGRSAQPALLLDVDEREGGGYKGEGDGDGEAPTP
jgi:hypothetical protein